MNINEFKIMKPVDTHTVGMKHWDRPKIVPLCTMCLEVDFPVNDFTSKSHEKMLGDKVHDKFFI